MSSSDGFCSTLSFLPGELGQQYTPPLSTTAHQSVTSTAPSINQTPLPTPTHASPSKHGQIPATANNAQPSPAYPPPASPARSTTSASSTNTPSSQQQAPVINNPTPTLGSVPLVTAAHSAQPPALPLTTPPQTPMSAVSQTSSNNNNNTSVLGKRDVSESSGKEENKDSQDTSQQQPKKRRVAPTLISNIGDGDPSSKQG